MLGQANVDKWYGNETAYNIWQATKKFAGYYNPQGQLGGVGYTIVDGVFYHLSYLPRSLLTTSSPLLLTFLISFLSSFSF